MKRIRFISLICVLCFMLSGCIDIFQSLTKDSNGVDKTTIKVSVSKLILAMANGFSDSDKNTDYEKLFEESELNTVDIKNYSQFGATVKKVNDTMDVGYLLEMNIDYRDRNTVNRINQSNVSFIPRYNGKNVTVHIGCLGDSTGTTEDNAMAAAFLSAGKYRLAISKKCIAAVSKAVVVTTDGEMEIGFVDLYDQYLVEIPISFLYLSDVDLTVYSK